MWCEKWQEKLRYLGAEVLQNMWQAATEPSIKKRKYTYDPEGRKKIKEEKKRNEEIARKEREQREAE